MSNWKEMARQLYNWSGDVTKRYRSRLKKLIKEVSSIYKALKSEYVYVRTGLFSKERLDLIIYKVLYDLDYAMEVLQGLSEAQPKPIRYYPSIRDALYHYVDYLAMESIGLEQLLALLRKDKGDFFRALNFVSSSDRYEYNIRVKAEEIRLMYDSFLNILDNYHSNSVKMKSEIMRILALL